MPTRLQPEWFSDLPRICSSWTQQIIIQHLLISERTEDGWTRATIFNPDFAKVARVSTQSVNHALADGLERGLIERKSIDEALAAGLLAEWYGPVRGHFLYRPAVERWSQVPSYWKDKVLKQRKRIFPLVRGVA